MKTFVASGEAYKKRYRELASNLKLVLKVRKISQTKIANSINVQLSLVNRCLSGSGSNIALLDVVFEYCGLCEEERVLISGYVVTGVLMKPREDTASNTFLFLTGQIQL